MLNESDMSVVVVSCTPQKEVPHKAASSSTLTSSHTSVNSHPLEGLSSQILPLSRLSMSSNASPPNPNADNSSDSASSNGGGSDGHGHDSNGNKTKDVVKGKLDKIRRSLTEPLMNYFHELQVSPESEEPDVLGTPKSLVSPDGGSSPSSPRKAGLKAKRSRNLLSALNGENESSNGEDNGAYENMPPIIITDM